MLDKLSITECRKFLKSHSNRINYPKIYEMIYFYVDCYDNNKSQYMIKDKRTN